MRYTVEQKPQIQPAACSMLGIHEDDWFVRIPISTSMYNTILLSKTAFEEIAKERGYVKRTKRVELLEELSIKQDELAPTLRYVLDELSTFDNAIQGIQALRDHADRIGSILEGITGELKNRTAVSPGDNEGPFEPPSNS